MDYTFSQASDMKSTASRHQQQTVESELPETGFKQTEELTKYEQRSAVQKELFRAADVRIRSFNKGGISQGRAYMNEPERKHTPDLINMEEYEDWTKEAGPYSIDRRLKREENFVGEQISLEDILKDVTTQDGGTKTCRRVFFLGAAGMGKTTLMGTIAQDARDGKYEMLKGKLILMPDFRSFTTKENIRPSHALLGSMFSKESNEKMEKSYEWIQENSEEIVFVIDSLDTLSFDLNNEREVIGYHETTTVDVILHNLLAQTLFPNSVIISSSREFKVRNLHPSVRPDRCILLDGLSNESVRDLIDGFLGKDVGERVKKHIDTECPDIWPLLSIPVVLVFSIISFVQRGFKPKTMSGILIKFFSSLLQSPHVRVENVDAVLTKLMPLSFEGIKDKRVLFLPEDIRRIGLSPDEATDIGVLIPQDHGNYLLSKLMQNDRFFLYFNHQTQQECLAALHALSLETGDFQVVVIAYLSEPRFSVVRRLVCGILLDDEVQDAAKMLLKISNVEDKRNILLKSISDLVRESTRLGNKEKLLELFICLNEGEEGTSDLIKSLVKKIDLSFVQLNLSDVQAIASVMKQCEHIEGLDLSACNLNGVKMKILTTTLVGSNLKIDAVYIGTNDLGQEGMSQLANLCKHCEVRVLGMYGCRLDAERLKTFCDQASEMKLRKVYASNNTGMGKEGMIYLGKLITNCEIEEFGVRNCNLIPEQIETFAGSLGSTKLQKLDVSVNKKIGPDGMYLVGKLAKDHSIGAIGAAGCGFKSEHIHKFVEGLGNAKVKSLDMNDRSNKPPYTRTLLDLVPLVEVKLDLRNWRIRELEQQELQNKLDECGSSLLEVLLDKRRLRASAGNSASGNRPPDPRDDLMQHPPIKPTFFATKEKVISGTHGGEIGLGACKINFPPGSLKHDAKIEITVDSGSVPDRPESCIQISPILGCDLSEVGLVPGSQLEVEIQAYCFSHESVPIKLLTKTSDSEYWEEEKELTLGRNRKIKFKTSRFSRRFYAFVRGLGLGWLLNIPVVPHLYYDKFGVFEACLCLDNAVIINDIKNKHKEAGFRSALVMPEHMHVKLGDSIGINLQCTHPPTSSFGEESNHIVVSDDLIDKVYVEKDFLLNGIPKYIKEGYIEVYFTLSKERPVPDSQKMKRRVDWPIPPADPSVKDSSEQKTQGIYNSTGSSGKTRSDLPVNGGGGEKNVGVASSGPVHSVTMGGDYKVGGSHQHKNQVVSNPQQDEGTSQDDRQSQQQAKVIYNINTLSTQNFSGFCESKKHD